MHLQQALASHIDPAHVHFNKTFASVDSVPETDSLLVAFTDGTKVETDILLGADGIRSAVRQHFVPTSAPKWTGWVAFRTVFDASRVAHIPGALDEAYHWWGPDRTFFSSKLGADLFTIVGGYHGDPHAEDAAYRHATWNSPGDVEVLKGFYRDWNSVVKAMIDAAPDVRQYPNTFAAGLASWVLGDGRVTLAGDSAHAHGGAFAAGGSLAADDAYAFARAVAHVMPPDVSPSGVRIEEALKLYEAARKAHTDRVLAIVHQGNKKMVERVGKTETDEELRARMMGRSDPFWIHEHDVEAAFVLAVAQIYDGDDDDRARL